MKALTDKAEKRRRQALAAAMLADEQLCRGGEQTFSIGHYGNRGR
jgi:hypothetical protein